MNVSDGVLLSVISGWTLCHRYSHTVMCDLVHDSWSSSHAMVYWLEPSWNVWQVLKQNCH